MSIIDLHAHMLSLESLTEMRRSAPDHAPTFEEEESGIFLSYPGRARMGPVPRSMVDIVPRLEVMDRQEIDVQVLAVPPSQYHYHVPVEPAVVFARAQNDGLVEIAAQRPDRFQVLATLPLQDPAASIEEIGRLISLPLVRGVQIGTQVDGRNLDDASLEPVWAALSAADLPVWLHPDQRGVAGEDRLGSYYLVNLVGNPLESTIAIASLIFGGVMDRYPALRIGVVHGGGFAPYQIGRWDHGYGQRRETREHIAAPPSSYFRRIFFDSLTHDETALGYLVRQVGVEQVVLGSDYPFDMASDDSVGTVRRLGLNAMDERAILEENAERFLRKVTTTTAR